METKTKLGIESIVGETHTEKIKQTLDRYGYWREDKEYIGGAGYSCSHCSSGCHGDGQCGGDGD